MDSVIKKLNGSDIDQFTELVTLFAEVFEMQNFNLPDPAQLQQTISNEHFISFVAINEEKKIIGGLTAYILLPYYSSRPLVYLYDLAVAVRYQRKGIGKRLINALNDFAREKGMEEVFVQADRVDDYALDFYRKTSPTNEEDVVHFYYTL